MVEASLLQSLFTVDSMIELAIRAVVSGIILFFTSRLVGAKGGLLACMGVAVLSSVITIFILDAYVIPMLSVESTDIVAALEKNVLGYVLSYMLPGAVWFFVVILLLRVGPMHALMLAFVQWLLGLALSYFGIFTFLQDFL